MVLIDLSLPPSANQRLIPYVINMSRRIIGIKDSPKYRDWMELEAVSYTHLTLPTNREV